MGWLIKHLIKIDGELFEIPLKVYNHLEQQKQRADTLEKRWSELKKKIIKLHNYSTPVGKQNMRGFLVLMDELEGKENIFETVQQLEEDGE